MRPVCNATKHVTLMWRLS